MRALFVIAVAVSVVACAGTKESKRYSREAAAAAVKKLEVTGLVLGEFPIEGASSVIDGDTVRVKGLDASLRLLAIDTEETFKHDSERQAFSAGWEQYKKKMRGSSSRPVKMATPNGDEAKKWAQKFFDGANSVKIERDHPGEIRDFYNRYLAYIFVKKNGEWVNYNLECVRAGYSPYFVKYGRSRRFHEQFVEAEKNAREAKLGIWSDGGMHYDDYDERLKWWWEREHVIARFEHEAEKNPDAYVALTRWDAMHRLEQKLGTEVSVLGSVAEIQFRDKGPSVAKLARSRVSNFDIVFFDRDVLLASGIQFKKGEFVQVRGIVTKYRDSRGGERLQIHVQLPGQVIAPSSQLDTMLNAEKNRADDDSEGD
ncbi:MAG: thermonuclease family protein [Archangium sp.]|nr:thermonuclease family protein [Archangium sp.]